MVSWPCSLSGCQDIGMSLIIQNVFSNTELVDQKHRINPLLKFKMRAILIFLAIREVYGAGILSKMYSNGPSMVGNIFRHSNPAEANEQRNEYDFSDPRALQLTPFFELFIKQSNKSRYFTS